MTAKRLFIYIASGIVGLVGIIGIYGILSFPAKQPYRDAKAAYQTVYSDIVSFTQRGISLNVAKASEKEFAANIASARSALEAAKKSVATLADQQVLKDGEGEKKYAVFSKRFVLFAAYNSAMLASIETLRPILLECSSAMAGLESNRDASAALRHCATQLTTASSAEKTPDTDYRAMAVSFAGIYAEIAQATDDISMLADPKGVDSAQHTTLTTHRDDLINELNGVNTTLAKNLSKHRTDVDITASAKALDDYLSAKSRLLF